MLRRIKHKINAHKLELVIDSIFTSKFRYGIAVYTNPKYEFSHLEQQMDPNVAKLQVVQNDMLRMLIGHSRQSHINMQKLREEKKVMSVNQISCYHVAIEMFNIIHNGSSNSLQKEFKLEQRGYQLRSLEDGKVKVPQKGKKSCTGFSYSGPKLWNHLPSEMRTTNKREEFKAKIKDWIWTNIPSV